MQRLIPGRWDLSGQCDLKHRAKTKDGVEADFCSVGLNATCVSAKAVKLCEHIKEALVGEEDAIQVSSTLETYDARKWLSTFW